MEHIFGGNNPEAKTVEAVEAVGAEKRVEDTEVKT
jgi:hypothetical protein